MLKFTVSGAGELVLWQEGKPRLPGTSHCAQLLTPGLPWLLTALTELKLIWKLPLSLNTYETHILLMNLLLLT